MVPANWCNALIVDHACNCSYCQNQIPIYTVTITVTDRHIDNVLPVHMHMLSVSL